MAEPVHGTAQGVRPDKGGTAQGFPAEAHLSLGGHGQARRSHIEREQDQLREFGLTKAFNIGDRTLVGLPVGKVIGNETVLETVEGMKDKPKNTVLDDLKVRVGDTGYRVKATVVPIISTEVTLMETMILFDHIQKRVLKL